MPGCLTSETSTCSVKHPRSRRQCVQTLSVSTVITCCLSHFIRSNTLVVCNATATQTDGAENARHESAGHDNAGPRLKAGEDEPMHWCTTSCEPERRAEAPGMCPFTIALVEHTLQVIADSEDDDDEQATAAASAASAAASHSASTDIDDICEVRLSASRTGVALVPCEQAPRVSTLSLLWAVRSADHG